MDTETGRIPSGVPKREGSRNLFPTEPSEDRKKGSFLATPSCPPASTVPIQQFQGNPKQHLPLGIASMVRWPPAPPISSSGHYNLKLGDWPGALSHFHRPEHQWTMLGHRDPSLHPCPSVAAPGRRSRTILMGLGSALLSDG